MANSPGTSSRPRSRLAFGFRPTLRSSAAPCLPTHVACAKATPGVVCLAKKHPDPEGTGRSFNSLNREYLYKTSVDISVILFNTSSLVGHQEHTRVYQSRI